MSQHRSRQSLDSSSMNSSFVEDSSPVAVGASMAGDERKNVSSPNVWKRHLLLLQENAPKPKPVFNTQFSMDIIDRPSYYGDEYYGPISREDSDRLLSDAGDGAYLVRESQREIKTYTLCMRFDGTTKNYKLYYDGQHYVGDKRFDTLNDLVGDGLISMYVEKHAADYIRRMAEETVYEESPYNQYHRRYKEQRKLMQRKSNETSSDLPASENDSTRKRNLSQGSNRSLSDATNKKRKAHRFKPHTFKAPHWCDYCRNYMWGLVQQGSRCEDCGFSAHKKCSEKVTTFDCRPDLKYIRRTFAVDLTTLTMAHNVTVPPVVELCIEEIETRGLNVEGIYRVSGSYEEVEKLRGQFDTDNCADLSRLKSEDVHTLASLLKLYLRLLPLPLITFCVGKAVSQTLVTVRSEMDKLKRVRSALEDLPIAHYRTLGLVAKHLNLVAQNCQRNKMTLENLARVFAPTLTCPSSTQHHDPLASSQQDQTMLCFILANAEYLFVH